MRKISLAIISTILLTSCFKDDIDPVVDRNSSFKLEHINYVDLDFGEKFVGRLNYKFLVESDTSSNLDTISEVAEFDISYPVDYNQTIDFNTPARAKKILFNLNFKVVGGGRASYVSVTPLSFQRNGVSYYNSNLTISGERVRDSIFNTTTQIIELP